MIIVIITSTAISDLIPPNFTPVVKSLWLSCSKWMRQTTGILDYTSWRDGQWFFLDVSESWWHDCQLFSVDTPATWRTNRPCVGDQLHSLWMHHKVDLHEHMITVWSVTLRNLVLWTSARWQQRQSGEISQTGRQSIPKQTESWNWKSRFIRKVIRALINSLVCWFCIGPRCCAPCA